MSIWLVSLMKTKRTRLLHRVAGLAANTTIGTLPTPSKPQESYGARHLAQFGKPSRRVMPEW